MQTLDPTQLKQPESLPAAAADSWIAHKFGGTSMADAACINRVADLLLARPESGQAIVVSAMRGVTDALTELADAASRRSRTWEADLQSLRQRHSVVVAGRLQRADGGKAGAQPDFETGQLVDRMFVGGAGNDGFDGRVLAPEIGAAQRADA